MDFRQEAQKRAEAMSAQLRRIGAPQGVIDALFTEENLERLAFEIAGEQPEAIAAFCAAHPAWKLNPESEMWESVIPLNADEIAAWNRDEQAQRAELTEALKNTSPGQRFTTRFGVVFERQAITVSGDDPEGPEGDTLRAAWKRIADGTHSEFQPERDFGATTVGQWLRNRRACL